MPPLVKAFEAAVPVIVRLDGIISAGLSAALKFLMPYALQAGQAVADFAGQIADRVLPIVTQFWNKLSVGLDWLQANWKYIWPSLSQILKGTWDIIAGIVRVAWSLVSGIIKIGLDILSGNWKQAWTDFKDMLGGIWGGIQQIIQGQIENIKGIFSGLAQMAISWGQNLIGGFVQGIRNSLGSIGNVMSSVVNTIGSWLPHSPAKQGELSHLNEYGPSFVKGFADGITKSRPMLTNALNMTVSPFAMLQTQSYSAAAGGSSVPSGGFSGAQEIYIMLDGKQMAHVTAPHIVKEMRVRTGMRGI
jgi:phage-related protein